MLATHRDRGLARGLDLSKAVGSSALGSWRRAARGDPMRVLRSAKPTSACVRVEGSHSPAYGSIAIRRPGPGRGLSPRGNTAIGRVLTPRHSHHHIAG